MGALPFVARRRSVRLAGTGRRKRPPAAPHRSRPYAMGGGSPKKPTPERSDVGRTESLPDFLATKVLPGTALPPSLREAVGAEKPGDGLERDQCDGAHHKKGQRYQCQQGF